MTTLIVRFTKPSDTALTAQVLSQPDDIIKRGDGLFFIAKDGFRLLSVSGTGIAATQPQGLYVRGDTKSHDNHTAFHNFPTTAERDAYLARAVNAIREYNASRKAKPDDGWKYPPEVPDNNRFVSVEANATFTTGYYNDHVPRWVVYWRGDERTHDTPTRWRELPKREQLTAKPTTTTVEVIDAE